MKRTLTISEQGVRDKRGFETGRRFHAAVAFLLLSLIFSVLVACAQAGTAKASERSLPVEGKLPALDATAWIGTPVLTPKALKGKVVLVDFWTYSCINCIRVTPYLNAWADKYRDQGFVVLGVHTPEFGFEKRSENIQEEMKRFHIAYPVAVDSEYKIWNAFGNQYWPAMYLVDANGRIRYHQFGEGNYPETESAIQQLLAEAGRGAPNGSSVVPHASGAQAPSDMRTVASPETYLGYREATGFISPEGSRPNRDVLYSTPSSLRRNTWALAGSWTIAADFVQLNNSGGTISYRFAARDLHLVMAPSDEGKPVRFQITIDGLPPGVDHGADTDADGHGVVIGSRLYQLVRQRGGARERTLQIRFEDAGLKAFVFTFG